MGTVVMLAGGMGGKIKKKKAKPCKRNMSASERIKQLDGRSV